MSCCGERKAAALEQAADILRELADLEPQLLQGPPSWWRVIAGALVETAGRIRTS